VSAVQELVLESRPTLWEEFASESYHGASGILGGADRPEKILRIRSVDGGLTEFHMILACLTWQQSKRLSMSWPLVG
jgi:hypothetical protein